jgi:uncharacterized protein (DUF885 family)
LKISHPLSRITICFASVFLFSNCSGEAPKPQASATSKELKSEITQFSELTELYAEAGKTLFLARPLDATSAGVPQSLVGANINRQMTRYDPESESKLRSELVALNNKLAAFSENGLSSKQLENKQVMESVIRYFSGNSSFSIGYVDIWMGVSPFILNQINGPILDAPRALTDSHQVNNSEDAENYIVRLGELGILINGVQQKFIADAELKWQPPKEVLEGAISHLKSFTDKPTSTHGLVTSFANKLDKIDDLSAQQRRDFVTQAEKAMEQKVYPAYSALAETATKWLPKSTTESGIWAQPNGAAFYQEAILQLGDSELTADQIHQIGLDEVDRITAQMNSILEEQGYESGSVGERMVALSKEPRFLYEDSKAGRAKLIADVNGFIVEMTEKMSPLFKTKPKYQVEVRSFPKETQDSMPGGQYSPPPLDGSIPGIYWINLRDMEAVASFTLKTLTYHEANPGHHWQISIALEQKEMPFLRLVAPYNAFIEGWALYSEQVAYELGMYNDDPFGNLGRLQDELFRAVRLVVDTGLHHKSWSRDKAIKYMQDITGTPESSCRAEIERYMAWPGQALGYKLGMLTILELRKKAETALGDKFDLAEFHDVILTGAAVPMSVLKLKINEWINART